MFNFLASAVKAAVNSINTAISNKKPVAKQKTAPVVKKTFKALPKTSFAKLTSPIKIASTWVNKNSSPAQQAAARAQIARSTAGNSATLARNAAILAQNKAKAAARAEEQRRMRVVMKFNQTKMKQLGFRAKEADKVKGRLLNKAYNKAWYGTEAPTEFDKIRREYQEKAQRIIDQSKEANRRGSSWLTGNNVNAARDQAQKQIAELQTHEKKRYDTRLNSFLAEQATKKANIEKQRFGSEAEFNKAVAEFSKWEDSHINDLQYTAAAVEGLLTGYDNKAKMKNKTLGGRVAGAFTENILPFLTDNKIFKYTLGSGDKNAPSLVTAPSRAVNTVGNLFNDKRNYHGGETKNGKAKDLGQAWRQSYDQRNFNISQPKKGTTQDFDTWFKTRDLSQWRDDLKSGKVKEDYVKKLYRKAYDTQVKGNSDFNKTAEFFADPLFGLGKATKGVGSGLSWAAKAGKATKTGAGFFKGIERVKATKQFKWLNAEHKTAEQRLGDALTDAKTKQREIHQKLMPRIEAMNARLSVEKRLDTSILRDLGKLTDGEARVLQRMAAGKFAFRDKLALRDIRGKQYSAPQREKLMDLYNRWTDFSEKMKLADNVSDATRFGRSKKFYAPNTAWISKNGKMLDEYNFRLTKRRKSALNAADLQQGATDRFLVSNLTNSHHASELARKANLKKDINRTQQVYKQEMAFAKRDSGVDEAFKATRTKSARLRKLAGQPTSIWKKAVLKYRPAWTVNNVGYNVPAATLAGGPGALIEHGRLLFPKKWRAAMDEVPANVKADLTGELPGKGKLNRFYNNVENWSRVSAYRAAKAKGLTDAQALKRVDKYLYNYKTKNWEQPIKGVFPFWAWNKNLARAAVEMPFDRPLGAKIYNKVDHYQNNQFDEEFKKVVPELTKLGYNEKQIEEIKQDQAKYFKGRLKVGDKWITTPFNAFSEKGLGGLGANPYLSAYGESATGKDSFGREIDGTSSLLRNRVLSKFPQYGLAKKSIDAWRVENGLDKPSKSWISKAGSAGYGLTKEQQGFDKSKTTYSDKLDPRAKLGQDGLAFLGVPRGLDFSTDKLVERKRLEKLSTAYFALDTDKLSFKEAETARNALFKKYGVSSDDFYTGLLAKYDTDNTKRIKNLKADARTDNKKLFEEYAMQPYGTRNMWAVDKLRQLNDDQYFDSNPFKKSFDWITPGSVERADRQKLYSSSKATGDWSNYKAKYGQSVKVTARNAALKSGNWTPYYEKYGKSQKALDRDKAVATGDWSVYEAKYSVSKTTTPYRYGGKYFTSSDSMARYKKGEFWKKYGASSRQDRKTLLLEHPEYNERADWTDKQWDDWKIKRDAALLKKARAFGSFASLQDTASKQNTKKAQTVWATRNRPKVTRLTWSSRV